VLFKSTAALASLGMAEGEILHHLKPVAEGIGLRGKELYSTVKSGVKAGHANPRNVPTGDHRRASSMPPDLQVPTTGRKSRPAQMPQRFSAAAVKVHPSAAMKSVATYTGETTSRCGSKSNEPLVHTSIGTAWPAMELTDGKQVSRRATFPAPTSVRLTPSTRTFWPTYCIGRRGKRTAIPSHIIAFSHLRLAALVTDCPMELLSIFEDEMSSS
jgi:hypothetical protein